MANKFFCSILLSSALSSIAAEPVDSLRPLLQYEGEVEVWGSTGDFAPYYIMSNRSGRFIHASGIELDIKAERKLETKSRFEYGFGAEFLAGHQSAVDYRVYSKQSAGFSYEPRRPASIWLQQLWGGVKYRGVFIKAGLWEHEGLFNTRLGVGDLTLSQNARPIPRVAAGFIDFQDIPFTRGWVQIRGQVSWGKFADGKWLEDHYNYYNSVITTGVYMQYSNCYFRTDPSRPFSVTVGMQHATQFGGDTRWYHDGVMTSSVSSELKFKDLINAFFPWTGGSSGTLGDQNYFNGNHVGSWDLRLRYRLRSGHEITAYMQSPWEDGSGIGKLNGFDGVWGLEYSAPDADAILSGAVVEYIDFTNQSGPMHWAPGDFPGTQIPAEATGADDYYNNFMYNGWTNYGMSIGTPFVKSPVYNTDGYMRFTDNRIRGFQIGAEGALQPSLRWRALLGFRTSWGTPLLPALERTSSTSMLLEAAWKIPAVSGLKLSGSVAWDAGKLLGNNFGALLSISYSGAL